MTKNSVKNLNKNRIGRFKAAFRMLTGASLALTVTHIGVPSASALELNWAGDFRASAFFVDDYAQDGGDAGLVPDLNRVGQGGYYVPPGGQDDAIFQSLFLRLKPNLVVNDNVYLRSEWWVGNPVLGFYGDATPYTLDQRQYYSNQSRGAMISAQRFWLDILTDVGTVQIGRAPLNWGLGLVWDAGNDLWARYQSTGDAVRLVSKFGAFTFTPSFIKYSAGNNLGGACVVQPSGACDVATGSSGVTDYSLILKYENPDEDFEAGVNFIKRISGAVQDPNSGYLGVGGVSDATQPAVGMKFNIWDLYARKKVGRFSLGVEAPITSGDIGGITFDTFAIAFEGGVKFNDAWSAFLKAGHAPGQNNITTNAPSEYNAFYFHPNYDVALIMFNLQRANFRGPSTLNNASLQESQRRSPFDNPIVNANYLALGGGFQADKWNFHANFAYARADNAASTTGNFFNTWDRKFYANNAGVEQDKSLGWEMDYGTTFKWDDNLQVGAEIGWFFPGSYYKFSNVAGIENPTDSVFAAMIRAGVSF